MESVTRSRQTNGAGSKIRFDQQRRLFVTQIWLHGKRTTLRAETKKALLLELQKRRVDASRGLPVTSSNLTLKGYLGEWLAALGADGERRPGTVRTYGVNVRHLCATRVATLKLSDLTPRHVQQLIRELRASGLSEGTVRTTYATLRVALGDAVELEELARNPAQVARRKGRKRGLQTPRKRIEPLDVATVQRLVEVARTERLGALFIMAVSLGLRRGELLGLRWQDVDFKRRRVTIRHQLGLVTADGPRRMDFTTVKTDGSERTVDMPDMLVDALLAHKDRQRFEQEAALNLWTDRDLVFCTHFGGGIETASLYKIWNRVRTAAGTRARLHDLRHTAASLMLAQGCDLWQVSKILGHSGYQITVDTYGHLYNETRRTAADLMNAVLTGS